VGEALELGGHGARREDEVDEVGGDGRLGHAGVLGRLRVLGDDQASRRFDLAEPGDPVVPGPGQDDRDPKPVRVGGHGAEHGVDAVGGAVRGRLGEANAPVHHLEALAGRRDVEAATLEGGAIPRGFDGRGRLPAEKLVERALHLRVEVLDHDRGEARLGREVSHEGLQRFQPAGGGSDAYDGHARGRVPARLVVCHGLQSQPP
jgi:hypothetical protein